MFLWLAWVFIFVDFRFLTIPHMAAHARRVEQVYGGNSLPQNDVLADMGQFGCLFSSVCSDNEICFDDNLLGRCISNEGSNIESADLLPIDQEFLSTLEKLMMSLWLSGFTWQDDLTQCVIKTSLLSYRAKMPMDLSVCEPRSSDSGVNARFNALLKRQEEPIRIHKYTLPALFRGSDDYEVDEDPAADRDHSENDEILLPPLEVEVDEPLPVEDVSDFTNDVQTAPESEGGYEDSRSLSADNDDLTDEADDQLSLPPPWTGDEEDPGVDGVDNDFTDDSPSDEEEEEESRPLLTEEPSDSARLAPSDEEALMASKRMLPRRAHRLREENSRLVNRDWVWLNFDAGKVNDTYVRNYLRLLSSKLKAGEDFKNYYLNESEMTFEVPADSMVSADFIVDTLKNNSNFIAGFTTSAVGFGTPQNHVTTEALNPKNDRFLLTVILCSAALAAVSIVLVIYFIQKHRLGSKKLWSEYSTNEPTVTSIQPVFYGSSGGGEAYRDLCRQHVQSKALDDTADNLLSGDRAPSGDRKHSGDSKSTSPRTSTSSWSDEPAQSNMDISTGHAILTYMEEHLTHKDKLDAEWQSVCSTEVDVAAQCKSARTDENAKKNRYIDAVPFDNARVKLQNVQAQSTDYINASYIYDHDPKAPLYIVSQGPLVNTAGDFWQMIWEQNSVTIVNLSCLMEAGVPMCHKYWPEEGSQMFGRFEVHLVSEHVWCEEYLVRSFYLKNLSTSETRTITQFHYISWPDLDVPKSSRSILEFRRKVNKSFRNKTSPIVIHCSDGCGRSGTYILLDMILTRLNRGVKEIDVAAALEHLRDQRMDMVKTKSQFEFVLKCIVEEVQGILKVMGP